MDALSEILRVVQLNSAVFFNARFTAPWCFASPGSASVMQTVQPGAECLIIYHLLTEGSCQVEVQGLPPRTLHAGEVVLFPHGDAHRMASGGEQVEAAPAARLRTLLQRRPRQLRFGGGGEATRFICGYLVCDPRLWRPVLAALPRMLSVRLRGEGPDDWLESAIRYAVNEAGSPRLGGEGVLAKLSEVMFVETLRRYATGLGPEQTGWLAGVRDRVVGKALSALHRAPASSWTLEALAREAGSSRTVLTERFGHFVGQSPMQYLQRWRMALAASLLRRSSMSLAQIAQEVGYETDTAFNRAFRREFGVPPATWRRTQVAGG